MAMPPNYIVSTKFGALRAQDWNDLVGMSRQNRITSGSGILFDATSGGTVLSVVKQSRPIRPKSEFRILPFALGQVNLNAAPKGARATTPNVFKLFYFPEGAVDVAGGWATCLNERYAGPEKFSKDGPWYFIADETGVGDAQHRAAQETVRYAFLHVRAASDEKGAVREAVVTNSQKIPEDFKGHETDCICLGKMSCPTKEEVAKGVRPKVLEQYVSGQVQVYDSTVHPWQLDVFDIAQGTATEWVKTFFFSEGGLDVGDDAAVACLNRPCAVGGKSDESGWFLVAPASGETVAGGQTSVAPLDTNHAHECAYLHAKRLAGGTTGGRDLWYVLVTNSESAPTRPEFGGSDDRCVCLGRFATYDASEEQYVEHPVVAEQYVTGQVSVDGAGDDGGDYPFRLRVKNAGTAERPDYRIQVYAPDNCGIVQVGTTVGRRAFGAADSTDAGWFDVETRTRSSGTLAGDVILTGLYFSNSAGSDCLFAVSHQNAPGDGYWQTTPDATTPRFVVRLGRVSADGRVAAQFVKGSVVMLPPGVGDGAASLADLMTGAYQAGDLLCISRTASSEDPDSSVYGLRSFNPAEGSGIGDSSADAHDRNIRLINAIVRAFDFSPDGEDGFVGDLEATRVYKDGCGGEDCFAVFKRDGSGDGAKSRLTHSGSENLRVSDVQTIRDAFTLTDEVRDAGGGETATVRVARLGTDRLVYTPASGAAHGTLLLGVGAKTAATSAAEAESVIAVDGLPADAVSVGVKGAGTPEQATVYLSSLLAGNGATGPKLSHAALDDTSPWDIDPADFAAASHAHGNISESGCLTHGVERTNDETSETYTAAVPHAGRILVSAEGTGRIEGDEVLSAAVLRGLSNAASVASPGDGEVFDDYLTGLVVKSLVGGSVVQTGSLAAVGGAAPGVRLATAFGGIGGDDPSAALTLTTNGATLAANGAGGDAASVSVTDSGIALNAPEGAATLANDPTADSSDTASRQIATCGWVLNHRLPVTETGLVKYTAGENGAAGVFTAVSVGDGAGQVAAGDHTHDYTELIETIRQAITAFPGFGGSAPGTDTANGAAGTAESAARSDHRHPLNVDDTAPAAAGGTASAGSAETYARRDHVHAVKFSGAAHGALAVVTGASDGTVGANGTPLGNGNSALNGVTDIEALRAIAAAMTSITDGRATFAASTVLDPNCTSGGDCLAYFDADKKLAHLGNDGMTVTKLQRIDGAFSYTGSGREITTAKLKYDAICAEEGVPSVRFLGFGGTADAPATDVALLEAAALPPKAGDEDASASNAPLADAYGTRDSNGAETDASKLARVGTSPYAARADHTHPVETDVGTPLTVLMDDKSEGNGAFINAQNIALLDDTWNVGEGKGLKECVCTRVVAKVVGSVTYKVFLFREKRYSINGSLIYRGPEYIGFTARA